MVIIYASWNLTVWEADESCLCWSSGGEWGHKCRGSVGADHCLSPIWLQWNQVHGLIYVSVHVYSKNQSSLVKSNLAYAPFPRIKSNQINQINLIHESIYLFDSICLLWQYIFWTFKIGTTFCWSRMSRKMAWEVGALHTQRAPIEWTLFENYNNMAWVPCFPHSSNTGQVKVYLRIQGGLKL